MLQIMYTVAHLGIADELGRKGPQTAEDLAASLGMLSLSQQNCIFHIGSQNVPLLPQSHIAPPHYSLAERRIGQPEIVQTAEKRCSDGPF